MDNIITPTEVQLWYPDTGQDTADSQAIINRVAGQKPAELRA